MFLADGPIDNEHTEDSFAADEAAGATAVVILLDGLHAELRGTLAAWHATLGDRLPATLGPARAEGAGGWEVLAHVQSKAREVLVSLAAQAGDGAFGASQLMRRLALVEDAFAGALRRIAVPDETSVRCAADLAAAVGALFGLVRPAQQTPPRPAHPYPAESAAAANDVTREYWGWAAGMP
ncbi:hypothetical protein HXP44_07130 [Streptomyces sioyaensis]|uniref:Uncharacterized protein n=1 Tax=Streptomyces sioyaensis TaxID=67364 RepID=A0A4Q1R131_9ACTN|nr:hypothetical protein [Streptomyces sioyaensis]MBM4791832.1 hypothetical protein [Streptomyces sioyaensis]RXS68336.1 hypothetical protein EST54_09310 [Streptomyces sioyaensis]